MTRRRALANLAGVLAAVLLVGIGYLVVAAPPLEFANSSASENAEALACVPPTATTGSPPAKPIPTEAHARPVGPLNSGFAVAFSSSAADGDRTWLCSVDGDSRWTRLVIPADLELGAYSAVSDGQLVAIPAMRQAVDKVDSVVLSSPGAEPMIIPLDDAANVDWLADWSFWGWMEPIPAGGFLLAGGTRLATLDDEGRLTFDDAFPAGLTPISPTSQPGTWLVAHSDARQPGGGIGPPFMLWTDGQAQPTDIAGTWGGWVVSRNADGLAWLRGPSSWALLHADGSVAELPTTRTPDGNTDIAPDGSLLLVRSGGCGQGDAATCRVTVLSIADGGIVATLPAEGISSWREHGGLFITQGLRAPSIFRVAADGVRQVALPAAAQ